MKKIVLGSIMVLLLTTAGCREDPDAHIIKHPKETSKVKTSHKKKTPKKETHKKEQAKTEKKNTDTTDAATNSSSVSSDGNQNQPDNSQASSAQNASQNQTSSNYNNNTSPNYYQPSRPAYNYTPSYTAPVSRPSTSNANNQTPTQPSVDTSDNNETVDSESDMAE
ncbi:hypothetical protein NR996_05065 [Lactobacillus rodentium]|uniref:Lipoprotein n=1 Tax=Lactobacillus rodentium TaxID=947835 RepID=A0A2Z6T824_9LACO|nr:hypothetical protein [Lactobacillus rodentium]MCR1894778.1 hypothetical protein [Lactobacillus rodentium]GBG04971.1 hypothetical protein LrDSM24759_08850 [Lactobacillus rodentium]